MSNSKFNSINSANVALDFLHRTYYIDHTTYSPATSSHWRHFGSHQQVSKIKNGYRLSGQGFGVFQPDTILNRLKSIPVSLYISRMLAQCDPGVVTAARNIVRDTGRIMSHDVARMILTVEFLKKNVQFRTDQNTYAIIGDGFGTLGSLIKAVDPRSRIIFINLGRTLFFDLYYTHMSFPERSHRLLRPGEDASYCQDFNYIEAEHVFELKPQADVFISVASMQEINPAINKQYFSLIRNQKSETHFYCCNRISKRLPDGTITQFYEYGWLDSDELLVDELCPWHQEGPQWKPPFTFRFDGPHQHRLVRLKPSLTS